MFPPQSTPSKRPKRRVESYRIYKRPYSACSQSSRPSPSSYEKATHGRLVGPTLSTPRGDNNYNQYRPLCEVCPRDCDKVVGTLQGNRACCVKVNCDITMYRCRCIYTVDRTSQPEEMMLHSRDRRDATALATHVNKCTKVNWTVSFNITGNRKMMKNGPHLFKFSVFSAVCALFGGKTLSFVPSRLI